MNEAAFKLLGNIDADPLLEKVNLIMKRGWNDLCYDPGPPWNKMNKIQSLDMIILFSLPEKQNIILQKLIYNSELLTLFKDDIEKVSEIFGQHRSNYQPKRITLNNMRASSVIPEHTDFLYHYENTLRVHVPIITNEKVVFTFPSVNETLHMKVGEVVFFNNNIPHSGVNESEENRIHLIIDYGIKDDPYYGDVDYDWRSYVERTNQ